MNSALQELFRQLQQRELDVAELGVALNDLCAASPKLAAQSMQMLDAAVATQLLTSEQSQHIKNSLAVTKQSPLTTHSDVFTAADDIVVRTAHLSASSASVPMGHTEPLPHLDPELDPALGVTPADAAPLHEKTKPIAPDLAQGQVRSISIGPGSVIKSRFVLKEQIGSGGMGVVYAAVDQRKVELNDPNPMVALKILGEDFARHPQALMSLQREARKAQELAHPNIITVFDFDRDDDLVYMTMQLLQGRSLDSYIREVRGKGVDREVAMPIIKGIAEGLAYAHRKGIVHSDLKPANIFLSKRDNSPKLLDFGIARAVPNREATLYGKDSFDAGTLGAYSLSYATEEMIAGAEPHPSDDLYALGLICCELLSGHHPFNRLSAVEARKKDLKPAPIKGLSKQEWQTIASCLSFDRTLRPKDAGAFLQALNKQPASRTGLIAAGVALVTVGAVLAYSKFSSKAPPRQLANVESIDVGSSDGASPDTTRPSIARERPDAGKLEHVSVTSYGQGPTLQAAVDQALQLAMEQINGKSIDSSSTQFQGGMAVAFGADPMQLSTASFANHVTTQSRGTITDFRIVEHGTVKGGYKATINAKVAKFAKPASANRLRVAIAPLRLNSRSFAMDTKRTSSQEVSNKIQKRIADALVQSNRVAVLDREFTAGLDSEIDVIASGRAAAEDQARLSQQLVADYVLVGTLEKFEYKRHEKQLRLSERKWVSHSGAASLSLRLINVATRQAEFAGSSSIVLPETEPTTLSTTSAIEHERDMEAIVERMIGQLSDQSISKVLVRLYPITILAVDGDDVVLSQGEGGVREGVDYNVILRGKELRDPQTLQSLGRLESPCCTISVSRVTPSLAYAKVTSKKIDLVASFAPGALELAEPIKVTPQAPSQSQATPAARQSAPQQKAEQRSSSSKADNNW